MKSIGPVLLLFCLSAGVSFGQPLGRLPAVTASAPDRAPYLRRGDEAEKKYGAYRKELETFFNALRQRLRADAPELISRLDPPTPVPYGYQILPGLLADPSPQVVSRRIRLSPFSWNRTDSIVDHDRRTLGALRTRLDSASGATGGDRGRSYDPIVTDYKKLVNGQKFIENLIQYNRFWQGDIASHPVWYAKLNSLQKAALERQRINDSLSRGEMHVEPRLRARADSLGRLIDDHLRKYPTPAFVKVEHASRHRWVLVVPTFTDIEDSAFVERVREAIEDGWRVRDGDDDFSVKLEVRRLSPSAIYADGRVAAKGAHIDVDAHVKRFPPGGIVLTTGGNVTRATDRGIVLSPYATRRSTLVHEFGHTLGFKDTYFRSYEDRGAEGYEIVEVILGPLDALGAPESGVARREHFDAVLRELRPAKR